MSRAFVAQSLSSGIDKLVVLKVLNAELAGNAEARAAFHREATLSSQLSHPNTVYVFEVGEFNGAPMIVMEYLDGAPLSRVMSRAKQPLPPPLYIHVLLQVLSGLHHFHELHQLDGTSLNAVHRDVSPHNVVVLHEGGVKIVDFGIARTTAGNEDHTRTGTIKGKVHYMPPEQLLGDEELDRRADLFAVGVILWEAVARRRMWRDVDSSGVLRALASGQIPSIYQAVPGAPRQLQEVIAKATSAHRDDRYSTAEEMQTALEQAARDTVGIGQSRDLARFMTSSFGAQRQRRNDAIRAAMEESAPLSIASESGTRMAVAASASGPSSWSLVALPWYRSRKAALALAALALGVAGLVWLSASPKRMATSVPTAASEENTSFPADGEVTGKSGEPRAASAEDEPRPTAEAPQIAAQQPTEGTQDDSGAEPRVRKRLRRAPVKRAPASRRVTAPAPTPAPSLSAPRTAPKPAEPPPPAAATCDPPYRLTKDGVKLFKPECF